MRIAFWFIGVLVMITSCKGPTDEETIVPIATTCSNSDFDADKAWWSNGSLWLYAGENQPPFDITDWSLDTCQLRFGLGREYFPAVLTPAYESIEESETAYNDDDRFIVVNGGVVKAYSIELLVKHEVVNDTIDDQPIAIGYCVLADLAAVYYRTYCDSVFTFALSGYTYADPAVYNNIESFVMWDRETESLWWPLADVGVSGPMKDVPLEKYLTSKWTEMTFGELKSTHPNAVLLRRDLTVKAPETWKQFSDAFICK